MGSLRGESAALCEFRSICVPHLQVGIRRFARGILLVLRSALLRCLLGYGFASLVLATASFADTTVTVRSGVGAGGLDSAVTFLLGPSTGDFSHPFTQADFANAQDGPAAFVVSRNAAWISGLNEDPLAQWIGTNPTAGLSQGNTALYAVSFQVPGAFRYAALVLHYAVDDGLGTINKGVYLNGTAICPNTPIGFSQEHIVSCDVSSVLAIGTNWLYLDDVNAVGSAGLLFSATISTTLTYPPSISSIAVGSTPSALAFDGANMWVGNTGSDTVSKIRVVPALFGLAVRSDATFDTFAVANPSGATFDGANVWLTNGGSLSNRGPNTVTKLRATDGTILGTFAVGTLPVAAAFDGTSVWVANYVSNNVTKLRAEDGEVVGTVAVGTSPSAMAFDGENIWVTNTSSDSVTEIRTNDSLVVGTFPVGSGPYGIVFDGSNIWVANGGGNTVTKLNASDGATLGEFPVGNGPGGITFDGSCIWVALYDDNTVTEMQADGAILGTFAVGIQPWAMSFDGLNVWVTNGGSSTVSKIPARCVVHGASPALHR